MSRALTELQMRVIDVLWRRGEATVSEVQRDLRPERELARTTVATILSRLEEKEVVSHRERGREHVYFPKVEPEEIRQSMVRAVTDGIFGGSVPAMVKQLLGSDEVTPQDLREIREILARREEELGPDRGDEKAGREEEAGRQGEVS